MECLHFGAFVVGSDRRIAMVNKAARSVMGDGDGLIGSVCHRNVCPAEKGRCPIWDLGESFDVSEKVLLCPDGTSKDILKSVTPITLDGKDALIETFVDISSRTAAEKRLKESETRYRVVADNTYDWEFWLDPDGRFVYSSPSCERTTGYPAGSFMEDPALLDRIIHPDDLAAFKEHQHNTPGDGRVEFRIVRRDGGTRWIEHLCQAVYAENGGEYLGQRGNNRDVTERRLAEQEAARARDEWERTFDSITDPIMILDMNLRITRANRVTAGMLGVDAGALAGKSCHSVMHGADAPPMACPARDLLKDGRPHTGEVFVEALGAHCLVSVHPLLDAEGRLYGYVHQAHDISEIKRYHETLTYERNLARKYLDMAGVMILVLDPEGRVALVNRRGCEILEGTEDDIIGMNWFDEFLPAAIKLDIKSVFASLMAGNVKPVEYYENPIRTRSGAERTIAFHNTVLQDREGRITGVLFSGEDITARKEYEDLLEKMAHHDPLTGLPNRNLLQDRMKQAIAGARRHGTMLGVMYVDLDRFKEINDALGHETGDMVLVEFADRLRASIRASDTAARLGGDEFIVLLTEVGSRDDLVVVAEKIVSAMAPPFEVSCIAVKMTASIGISVYPDDGPDFETLVKRADSAMYRAKKRGGNVSRFFGRKEAGGNA